MLSNNCPKKNLQIHERKIHMVLPDGAFKDVARIKIRHYRNLYLNRPDPIAFIPLAVDTARRLYDDFIRLFLLHVHREPSAFECIFLSFH